MDSGVTGSISTANQAYLKELWSEQLDQPNLGINDDFFAAGGSSMQIIEMLMTVSEKFGREIDFAAFFKNPCIRTLDELLAG